MLIVRVLIVIVALTQVPATLPAQSSNLLAEHRDWNVPRWALEALGSEFRAQHEWHDFVNPFYQRGDFAGDGKADLALLIRQKATGRVGIAFVHRATGTVHVVGASTPLGNGGDDFKWLGAWRVENGSALVEVSGARAEVLYVEKPESASALIYWDGSKYQWVQRGD